MHGYSQVDYIGECYLPQGEVFERDVLVIYATIPDTGLLYVTVHVDFQLKKEVDYVISVNDLADNVDDVKDIPNLKPYSFGVSGSDLYDDTIQNINVFKNDPGFFEFVLDTSDNPIQGEEITVNGPDGSVIGTVYTDENGYYFLYFKHLGKPSEYTVAQTASNQEVVHLIKANKYVQIDFII